MKKALEGVGKGLSFLTNNKYFWYIVLAIIGYLGFKRFTKSPEEAFRDSEIPNSGLDIPLSWSPVDLVNNLHNLYMDWFPSGNDFKTQFAICNSLSDGQFVVMVKYYNSTFAKPDGQGWFSSSPITLWTRLNKSKLTGFGDYNVEYTKMKDRMIRLKQNY